MAGVLEGGPGLPAAMTLSEFHASLDVRASQCWASALYATLKCSSGIQVPLFRVNQQHDFSEELI